MHKSIAVSLLSAALLTCGSTSHASSVTFTGSGNDGGQGSGTNLSASVTFDLTGTSLTVTLQNTTANSAGGSYQNADVLTAVYWNSSSTTGASPVSAALGGGSALVETGGGDAAGPLGGNWEYATGNQTYASVAINQGIGSSGFGYFGSGNFDSPSQPTDGSAWGIISTSDTSPSDGTLNTSPYIQDTVVFNLTVASGTTLDDLTNVVFQYGTKTSEPSFVGTPTINPNTPEPSTIVLLATGVVGLGVARVARRRRHR